jgi:hypothetical protein
MTMFDYLYFMNLNDFLGLVDGWASTTDVFATELTLQDSSEIIVCNLREIPPLRPNATPADCRRQYLISNSPEFVVEAVPQRRGGINPASPVELDLVV